MLLLQTGTTAVEAIVPSISYIELAIKGGFPMIVIGIMSLYGLYIFITKFIELRNVSGNIEYLLTDVKQAVSKINRSEALRLCKEHDSPFGRILEKAVVIFFLHKKDPTDSTREIIENQCDLENHILERNISRLAVVATLAPMTGFLGTVLGILTTFMSMAQETGGSISQNLLSEGMYQAMGTTVAGLVVGIIAHGFYFFLARKLNDITFNMKLLAYSFMEMVHGSIE